MATVNFSVPEDVKEAFNQEFSNENKSAVLTRLMKRAIEEKKLKRRRARAIDAILELREQQTPVSKQMIQEAREEYRK